jgi:hypothetical protein
MFYLCRINVESTRNQHRNDVRWVKIKCFDLAHPSSWSDIKNIVNIQLTLSESIVIGRSPEDLYDMVSDVTRMGEWSPECKACWWDNGDGPRERFCSSLRRSLSRAS